MTTPTPSTNTPQKNVGSLSSPAPRGLPMALNFDSPAALGLSLSNLDGSVGMGISISGISGLGSLGPRADDEERRKRLETVVATVGTKTGRVSEESIQRLTRRYGLDFIVDSRKDGTRLLSLASKTGSMALDIEFKSGIAKRVGVEVQTESAKSYTDGAGKVFLEDLTLPPGLASINMTLDRFSKNLERLSRIDQLSTTDIDCFDALSGVYKALRRLFDHEKKVSLALIDAMAPRREERAERDVLCKKSGRARMNGNKTVGLSLDYWVDRRHTYPNKQSNKSKSAPSSTAMDIDQPATNDETEDDESRIYSLVIECEPSPAALYPPIRISDAWLSDRIEKPPEETTNLFETTIDWLDPPPTYLPPIVPEDPTAMNLSDTGSKVPDIRFVAKLNPPLVLPLTTAIQLLGSVNVQVPTESIRGTTYEGLLLRPHEADAGQIRLPGGTTEEIRTETNTLVVTDDGQEEDRRHRNSLFVPKSEFAFLLETIPFSHPQQLISLLPALRQHAFLNSLIRGTFLPPVSAPLEASKESLPIDITLTTVTSPNISIYFPLSALSTDSLSLSALLSNDPGRKREINSVAIQFHILPNSDITIIEQNLTSTSSEHNMESEGSTVVSKLGKALDVCGDWGVWVEWIKSLALGLNR